MTTQHRKLESLIYGHETRNCNVSLNTAAAAVAFTHLFSCIGREADRKNRTLASTRTSCRMGSWGMLGTRHHCHNETVGRLAGTMVRA